MRDFVVKHSLELSALMLSVTTGIFLLSLSYLLVWG
jgi:hypothetical protein